MPLLASLAVMLCTAMVLVTWSVMGGFLESLRSQGRQFAPDVTIRWPAGIGYYDELIAKLEQRPEVKAAAPMLETLGIVSLPDDQIVGVQVLGMDTRMARVIDMDSAMWWKPLETPLRRDTGRLDDRLRPEYRARMQQALDNGRNLVAPDPKTGRPAPAMIPGIEVMRLSDPDQTGQGRRKPDGRYLTRGLANRPTGDGNVESKLIWPPLTSMTLRVLPLDLKGRAIALAEHTFPIANEFRTGIYQVDNKVIWVELSQLQRMMKMDAAQAVGKGFDPYEADGPAGTTGAARSGLREAPVVAPEPARTSVVAVAAKEGVSLDRLKAVVTEVYEQFAKDPRYAARVPPVSTMLASRLIQTWEDANSQFIGAVEKETGLVLFLLWFISLVASFCILSIFWAMISEKTKDIGVLRSIGASRSGIGALWIGYGLAIGLLGASLGVALALLIVANINPIHEWMGSALGFQIWDARTYYFTEIPSRVNPVHAAIVFASGLAMSLVGSLIPAIRAANLDPVRSLRFE
jgi:ABC-type lipoprotein release transport system permease subunit